MKNTFWKVWGIPVIIGICSAVGLLSALTGDGFYDLLSWFALGFPVIITIWFLSKKEKGSNWQGKVSSFGVWEMIEEMLCSIWERCDNLKILEPIETT